MATLFAPNYDGLRYKGSYDEILARLGSDSLVEPDRRAKQIRESPQIANLLDGEGQMSFVEMGKQQLAAATHQQVMQNVLQAASASGAAPAQQLRAAETQTSGPRMSSAKTQTAGVVAGDRSTQTAGVKVADAESQAWREQRHSGGTQTDPTELSAAQIFDIAADERMEEVQQGLAADLDAQVAASDKKEQKILRTISRHLGEEVGPAQSDFAHMMATSSSSAAANPESEHEPKGPRGRPRKTQPRPMEVDTPPAPTKHKAETSPALHPKAKARTDYFELQEPSGTADLPSQMVGKVIKKNLKKSEAPEDVSRARAKPKAKAKPKKTLEDEFQDLMADVESKPKPKASKSAAEDPDNEPEVASSSAGRAQHGVKRIEWRTRNEFNAWARTRAATKTTIREQAELRGYRFSPEQLRGNRSKKNPVKALERPELLAILEGVLEL